MASSETWDQLVTTALLGTARAGILPTLNPPLADLIAQPESHPEYALLAAAASVDLYRRAGIASATTTAEIPVAPPDTLPQISPASSQHLTRILADEFRQLLPEFLTACAAANKRSAETNLPKLLSFAALSQYEDILPLIQPTLGSRGHWLLQQNPAWQKIFDTPTPADFDTGSRQVRSQYLKQLRQADPAAARALLEKTWQQETPEERINFINIFKQQLTPADEPFLESALNDKRKEVRETAAELLATLPDSRLAQRMLSRVTPMLIIKKKLLRAVTLEVVLRDDITKDMARDNIQPKSPTKAIGEKAWILTQIIGATPLSYWTLSPEEILSLAAKHEFQIALIAGFIRAAANQNSLPWATAILSRFANLNNVETEPYAESVSKHLRELYPILPPEQREAIAASALNSRAAGEDRDLRHNFIRPMDHPWSLDFSRTFIAALAQHLSALEKNPRYIDYAINETLSAHVAYHIHPDTYSDVVPFIPADVSSTLSRALESMITTVTFRHHMLKELRT